jgi:hypothetical protein
MYGGAILVWNRDRTEALGVGYEQAFVLPEGNEIKMGSR